MKYVKRTIGRYRRGAHLIQGLLQILDGLIRTLSLGYFHSSFAVGYMLRVISNKPYKKIVKDPLGIGNTTP